ncbi:unnamed protein product [Thelazia callipaeda]|uniref:S10_plectin domain-containing protein n=1 Tax=Thelazia callipaeda TaxID=103827 RepID=A0A0N5CVR5_THECL|nr:unnamed protein product [Thelazia callipaeda]
MMKGVWVALGRLVLSRGGRTLHLMQSSFVSNSRQLKRNELLCWDKGNALLANPLQFLAVPSVDVRFGWKVESMFSLWNFANMLMPTKNRRAIYEYLFKEGVCVAKKDFNLKSHPDIANVTNLEVIKACKSLSSCGYVKEQFAWRHHYWYLTNEGIDYLREYLHLPAEIVPATIKAKQQQAVPEFERLPRGPKMESDRDAYRTAEKITEAGPGSLPVSNYRSGYGRGHCSTSGCQKHHLKTADASSLFLLKGELYRKVHEQSVKVTTCTKGSRRKDEDGMGKVEAGSVLRVSKEEEKKIAAEKRQRQERICELEKSLANDEEQRRRIQKILEEKSEIYNRIVQGEEILDGNNEPVEFLVDFNAKKREEEKKREHEAEKDRNEKSEAVHFNPTEEQRVYGVSHIPLSVSETKRQEEIQELLNLSKKTESNRAERKRLLEEREKKRWEQLNRIRKRRGLEELPPLNAGGSAKVNYLDIPLPNEFPCSTPSTTQSEPKKFVPVREWDRGKVMFEKWISRQRDERDEEFAPPLSYFR